MAASPIDIYRRQIQRELQAGNPTEHTHRPALKDLIESLQPGVTATNEPKRIACGALNLIFTGKAQRGPETLPAPWELSGLMPPIEPLNRDLQNA